ncbi:MAG: YabP/YqfC family sporulation protein [Bacilli bacterium]|nr:YabP/YqfC family sporulation protein [Bacilli bacterium]
MKLIESFKSYLLEEEFKINIFNNKVNVINYTDIMGFDSNEVIIKHKSGEVIIKGSDLIITKLLIDEVLIVGNIKNIELR